MLGRECLTSAMLMLPLGEPMYDEAGLWWLPWWCECSAATAPKVPFLLMLLILGRLEKRFVSFWWSGPVLNDLNLLSRSVGTLKTGTKFLH